MPIPEELERLVHAAVELSKEINYTNCVLPMSVCERVLKLREALKSAVDIVHPTNMRPNTAHTK